MVFAELAEGSFMSIPLEAAAKLSESAKKISKLNTISTTGVRSRADPTPLLLIFLDLKFIIFNLQSA